jgi:aerobic-type carbon monoxide dehydrogenase small subunit (CoxS/CutS family)
MTTQVITVTVNGVSYQRNVEPRLLLSDFLRHELSLTGTHVGCEHGICGTCTVLVDGVATRSCICLAVQADGSSVETVESLGRVDALHPVQQAFWEKHGLQCGFCTPWPGRCAASRAAGVLGETRPSVRLLYARHADERRGAPPRQPESGP